MKTDKDGYPTVCLFCEKPIVKTKQDAQYHYDHATKVSTAWHIACSPNTHPFYCKGEKAAIKKTEGGWECTQCGLTVNWVVT